MSSSALARLPFLHGVPPATIAAVKRVLRPMSVTAGTVLFRTGDDGDTCYLVERGALRVVTTPNGELLATIGPGAFVGELAVLLGEPRSATVVAEEDSSLLALSRGDLDALMTDHPALSRAMTRELGRRILHTNQRFAGNHAVRRSIVWPPAYVAEVAAAVDNRRVAVAAIAGAALGALPRGTGRVKAPDYGADDARLDAVLIGAGDVGSARAAKVVADADHVLCFGEPPQWLQSAAPPQRLVRVTEVARAARWATGRAVGLALSSGGSKTVAHVGVIRVLRDEGIEIDAVSGVSGGALATLGVAFDIPEEVQNRCLDELARATHWRRLDVNVPPRSGVWKGRRLRDTFAKWPVGPNLEDGNIPVWLVASDAATGATVLLDRGNIADATRASMSIPGAFDPWRIGDQVLLDGAIANPLPTDVLRQAGVGIVIASNVAGQSLAIDVDEKLPGLGQIMSRVLNTMERERIRGLLPQADVVIRPRVSASNSLDFARNDEVIDAGKAATYARLDDIRSLLAAASSVGGDAANHR